MKLNNKVFKKQGYIHLNDVIPHTQLKIARREAINLKRDKTLLTQTPQAFKQMLTVIQLQNLPMIMSFYLFLLSFLV